MKMLMTFCFVTLTVLLSLQPIETHGTNTIDERYHQPRVLQKPLAEHQTGTQLAGHADRVNTGTVWQIFTAREGVQGHANANFTGASESL